MSRRSFVRRRAPLRLETLEQRENPAGVLTTAVTGGVLTITGTDEAESFTIKQETVTNKITITGTNGTLIGGLAATTTPAAVTSIKMMLKGGDDTATLDNSVAFNLPGALTIDGGDGANAVTLTTLASPITLGGFSYTGGEGADSISIGQLGAGAVTAINGALNVSAGNGATSISLTNATVAGDLSVKSGIGADTLQLTTVTASKNVNFDAGFGDSALSLLGTTVVTGGVSYKALDGNDTLNLDNATINGKTGLTVAGGRGNITFNTSNNVVVSAGGVTLTGTEGQELISVGAGSFTTFGDLKAGNLNVSFSNSSTSTTVGGVTRNGLTVANLALTAGDDLNVIGAGEFNISKNLTLAATSAVGTISLADFEALQLGGNLTATSVGDQQVTLGEALVGGGVSLVSKKGSARFLGGEVNTLTFNKGITVNGLEAASVALSGAVLVKVGGDVTSTSTAGIADFDASAGNIQLAGGVKITAAKQANLSINSNGAIGATVAKDVSVTSAGDNAAVSLTSNSLTLSGKLTVKGATDATLNGINLGAATSLTIAKDVSVTAVYGDSQVMMSDIGDFSLGGKLTVTGGNNASISLLNSGVGTVSSIGGDVAVSATRGQAGLLVTGIAKAFNGNVSVKGYSVLLSQNSIDYFGFALFSSYAKNLAVTGGAGDDTVMMAGRYTVTGDTSFNLGDGTNSVDLSSTSSDPDFLGKLTVKTSNGNDSVSFINVQASKDVSVTSLAGDDVVRADGMSVFTKTFTADTGAGDDTIDLGHTTGLASAAATFTGKVTIKTGAGNDKLRLGSNGAATPVGDAFSIPVFTVASTIDGGLGLNTLGTDNVALASLTHLTVTNFV